MKVMQETDDDMFWDYGPPAKGSSTAVAAKPTASKPPAPERKASGSVNGSAPQRTVATPAASAKPPLAKAPTQEVRLSCCSKYFAAQAARDRFVKFIWICWTLVICVHIHCMVWFPMKFSSESGG